MYLWGTIVASAYSIFHFAPSKYLDNWNEKRRQHAKLYRKTLNKQQFIAPFVPDWADQFGTIMLSDVSGVTHFTSLKLTDITH